MNQHILSNNYKNSVKTIIYGLYSLALFYCIGCSNPSTQENSEAKQDKTLKLSLHANQDTSENISYGIIELDDNHSVLSQEITTRFKEDSCSIVAIQGALYLNFKNPSLTDTLYYIKDTVKVSDYKDRIIFASQVNDYAKTIMKAKGNKLHIVPVDSIPLWGFPGTAQVMFPGTKQQ